MARVPIVFLIVLLTIVWNNVLSLPQYENDGQELLAGKDTRYYGFPFFWFGRSFYNDDDDFSSGGSQGASSNRRSSTLSYAHVGAGWGR